MPFSPVVFIGDSSTSIISIAPILFYFFIFSLTAEDIILQVVGFIFFTRLADRFLDPLIDG